MKAPRFGVCCTTISTHCHPRRYHDGEFVLKRVDLSSVKVTCTIWLAGHLVQFGDPRGPQTELGLGIFTDKPCYLWAKIDTAVEYGTNGIH